jgi:FAD/FMN-containing dehydrogenase
MNSFAHTLTRLQQRLGTDIVKAPDEIDLTRHLRDFLEVARDANFAVGVAYPRSTADVSEILRICHADGLPVTPQGGMTGFVGGGVPSVHSLVLSMERMRAIEEIDRAAAVMTVQAGVPLQLVQNAADEADLLFPLDIGSRGSCLIGGNAATNAGGVRVLRFGMMRELVLGVEAVLADGTVVNSLNKMIKNNAAYDVKHLFIGSEGTLGVITRLSLRLFPKPRTSATAICALGNYTQLLELLRRARGGWGSTLSAFEAMWPEFYRTGTVGLGRRAPIAAGHGLYVLTDIMGTDPDADQQRFEALIEAALDDGVIEDAAIAQSIKETQEFWALRDSPGEYKRVFWPQLSFDVSLPTGQIGGFVEECRAALQSRWPDVQCIFFGHVADGNIHLSVKTGDDPLPEHEIEEAVYSMTGKWRGSISAEHGIGSRKTPFLHYTRKPEEMAVMHALKKALDPKGILNPGKVIGAPV